jgi:N-carbamoyl-L-amino-acid hydrolase
MMGSGVFAGVFDLDEMLSRADLEGRRVGDELRRIGYAGPAPCGQRPVGAYFEAHIEQGPVLEDTGYVIGAVGGVMGLRWLQATVSGQDAHAGPTPMHLRRDALLAASGLVGEVNRIAREQAPAGRGTVGYFQVKPNSINVVPGEVVFSVDIRHATAEGLDAMEAALRTACEATGDRHGVRVALADISRFAPTVFDASMIQSVRDAAGGLGMKPLDMVSGAGHDAVYLARVAPTAMIFVPCEGGISHNEIEAATLADCGAGTQVLLNAILEYDARLG